MKGESRYYFVKLIPPRPDFAFTMSDDEKLIMNEHSLFWRDLLEKGICIVYGPVFEPDIAYGIGIVIEKSGKLVKNIIYNDPSVKKGLNRIEMFRMMAVTK